MKVKGCPLRDTLYNVLQVISLEPDAGADGEVCNAIACLCKHGELICEIVTGTDHTGKYDSPG
jgi:hypothetical protein